MTLDNEKASTLLKERVRVARSRKTNELTDNEIRSILSVLVENEVFTSDTEETRTVAQKISWVGIDEGNDARYDADTKREVMEAWVTDLGISKSAIHSVRTGTGSYLVTAPTGPGKVAVMALARSDVLAESQPDITPEPEVNPEPNPSAEIGNDGEGESGEQAGSDAA